MNLGPLYWEDHQGSPSNFFYYFFFFLHTHCLFIYLLLATLGLSCCTQAFSSCRERGLLLFWYSGFSWCWLLLGRTGSGRAGFSSCSTRLSSCDWMVLGHSGFQSCDTGLISCGSRASECAGFRSCGCLAPGHLGFSSCGTQL